MFREKALESRRTLNDICRDFLDAFSEEFGIQLDLELIDQKDTDYEFACCEVSEYIQRYAVQRYFGLMARTLPELGLKPDEEKLSEFKRLVIDQLMDLRGFSISADHEPARILPIKIQPDESREMVEKRFDRIVNVVVATLTPTKPSRHRE